MSKPGGCELILASASLARQRLLTAAGLSFRVVPADIDEATLKRGLAGADPAMVAQSLARAKAEAVSRRIPEALVIGADQVLAFEGELFDKPSSLAAARAQLMRLRGATHTLLSGISLARGRQSIWQHVEAATLTMRAFSSTALDHYLATGGAGVTRRVGAYELEGPGIQLFERVEGDYFTMLGLPMLPLLAELRARGAIDA
jgi:septum formation protein